MRISMTTTWSLATVLLILAQSWTCQGRFLEAPSVQWTYRVPGGGTLSGRGFRSGNEVVVSPDGTTLFATADDGSLHFVNIEDLRDSFVYEPEPIAGTFTECRSGVTLVRDSNDDDKIAYVVYPVVDVPVQAGVFYDDITNDSSRTSTLSRLIAVNLDGSLRWSVPLNGAVVGNAVVGGTQNDKLYVVHNVPNFIGSSPTRGKVSVVLLRGNRPAVTASVSPLNRHGPFGPPTGTTVTTDDGSMLDVVVVAEAWDQGFAPDNGNVFLMKPSPLYEEFDGQGNDAYELKLISDWSVASATRPAVKSDSLEVFAGASGARLSGWVGADTLSGVVAGSQENVDFSWDLSLEPNKGNNSQPLLVAPILSKDQTVLYQAGASTEMYCVDTQTGDILWTSSGNQRGTVRTEPRLVEVMEDEPKVYVIEGIKGKVRQHDAVTGNIDWTFDCHAVSGIPCNDAVEADFSVAPSGNTLYYGDIFGKIVALEIAAFSSPLPTEQQETEAPKPEVEVSTTAPTPVSTPANTPAATTPIPAIVEPEKTSSPTWSPLAVATPAPIPQDVVILDEDDDTEASLDVDPPATVVELEEEDNSDSELSTSASVNGDENEADSFFSNDIMIILVAVCGGLALAIAVLLVAQKARSSKRAKNSPIDHELTAVEDDGKDWHSAQDEYEEACRRNEEETIREIVSLAPKTPSKGGAGAARRPSKKQKRHSPVTPSTLASIEESPAENELSFVSDAPPKNLEKSFDASFMEDKGQSQEVSLSEAPLPRKTVEEGKEKKLTTNVEPSIEPAELSSVEVVAKNDLGMPKQSNGVKSPDVVYESNAHAANDHAANDIMSVDGSLYLDDDSFIQGSKVEVASLSQFSVASTQDGGSDIGAHYPADEGQIRYEAAHSTGPGDRYMQPPRVASPLLQPSLSPEVADYLRRNQSSLSPNPMTPGAYLQPTRTSTMSPSPVTPPSEAGNSPADGSEIDKEVARTGQSVRPGGVSSSQSGRGRQAATDSHQASEDRSRSPSIPRPPVETDVNEEPEDAWNSFLFELARAEREFFNPSFTKKKKPKKERAQSPPPPPPPPYSPPDSPTRQGGAPPDPPVGGTKRQLL